MTEAVVVETEVVEEKQVLPFVDFAHKTFQAGLGVIVLTQEEIEHLFEKFVERGEVAEKEGRKMLNEMMEHRKKQAEDTVAGAQDELETSIERVLHRMNVPTKADITNLNKKVTALTKKVDDLLKETA
jgi:poly(hydroxyalkanoate) granule-associated protein